MAKNTIIAALVAANKAYKAALTDATKETAQAVAEHIAEALPPGFAMEWRQYTPYFNDGDACTFSVGTPGVYKFLKPIVIAADPLADGEDPPEDDDDEDSEDDEDDEDDFDRDNFGEDRNDALSLNSYVLDNYGQVYHVEGMRKQFDYEASSAAWQAYRSTPPAQRGKEPNREDFEALKPFVDHRDAKPEFDGLPRAALVALIDVWDNVPEDMLESAFGEHVSVRIKRLESGEVTYTTSEYSHD